MANLSVFIAHDANFCVEVDGEYRIFEVERFTQARYASLVDNPQWEVVYDKVKQLIFDEYGVDEFPRIYTHEISTEQKKHMTKIWKTNEYVSYGHHEAHAACAYYQSPFNECIIISFDGGGRNIEGALSFFNLFHAKNNQITRLGKIKVNLGSAYSAVAEPIQEIRKSKCFLSYAGKLMGLSGYGHVVEEWVLAMDNFFASGMYPKNSLSYWSGRFGINLDIDALSGQVAYDFAATAQFVFEGIAENVTNWLFDKFPGVPLCLTGGCALNVLFNERIKNKRNIEVFVPPNPNDCGLAFGGLTWFNPPVKKVNTAYAGWRLFDLNELQGYVEKYKATKISVDDIAALLHQGLILGIAHGSYECGPRALGNRSIICDPSKPNMKDILNEKVKFREWYRPFAPFVKKEKCAEYFDFDGDSPYMSFASPVKEKYRSQLKAITHVDGTARIQTVTPYSHKFFYDLLDSFERKSGFGVLLNTSFNIKGKPILNTIHEAIEVLNTTQIDGVVIEGYLFKKQ